MDNWITFKLNPKKAHSNDSWFNHQRSNLLQADFKKNAFIPLAIGIWLVEKLREIAWSKYLNKEGAGRKNTISKLVHSGIGSMETWKPEKEGVCTEFRLPAGSACETKIETKFIYPISTGIKFSSRVKTLPSCPQKSVFVLKLYFNYPNWKDPHRYAETTIYSMDLPDERNEEPGDRKKKLAEYNGYRYLVFFCLKVFRNKELFYGKIYANLIPSDKHLDHLHADNICLRVRELNEKKT